jgi:hypothetical protein
MSVKLHLLSQEDNVYWGLLADLLLPSTLKMEEGRSSETLLNFYKTARCHRQEGNTLFVGTVMAFLHPTY